MRVVSLVPSVTETLVAWGVPPVACTRFCEQPEIRSVGGTKNPDLAEIGALEPDLVVVDEEENRKSDYDRLVCRGLDVHVLAVRSVGDVAEQLPVLARRVGVTWEPPVWGSAPALRIRAAVPIWRRPYMLLGQGTYGASVLEQIGVGVIAPGSSEGGEPLTGQAGRDRYPTVEPEALADLAARGAEVVLVPTEPYRFGSRHRLELAELTGGLPVVEVDGQDLFWWGVRTGPALDRLAHALAGI